MVILLDRGVIIKRRMWSCRLKPNKQLIFIGLPCWMFWMFGKRDIGKSIWMLDWFSVSLIGHEIAHAQMSAFLAIISAIFTKLLQLKWSETDNCIRYWDSDSVSTVADDEEPWCCVPQTVGGPRRVLPIAIYNTYPCQNPQLPWGQGSITDNL